MDRNEISLGPSMKQITIQGRPFYVHSKERESYWDEGTARSVIEGNEYLLKDWEKNQARFGLEVVFDIGANIGAFTRLSKKLFTNANVVAVEAHPDNIPYLVKNTENEVGVVVLNKAVMGIPCPNTVMLNRHDDNGGGWALATNGTEVQTISIVTLFKDYVPFGKHLDLLKIDTEGCEVSILRAMSRFSLLARTRWIVLEWHGRKAIPELKSLLRKTHYVWYDNAPPSNGIMIASRKPIG